jgi:hypothetical protein
MRTSLRQMTAGIQKAAGAALGKWRAGISIATAFRTTARADVRKIGFHGDGIGARLPKTVLIRPMARSLGFVRRRLAGVGCHWGTC